jgi:hypothetical protein
MPSFPRRTVRPSLRRILSAGETASANDKDKEIERLHAGPTRLNLGGTGGAGSNPSASVLLPADRVGLRRQPGLV